MIFLVSCRPTHPGCSFCDDLHCWLKLKTFEDFATVQTFFKCQSASALKMRFENCQGIANSKLGSIRARFWLLPDIDVRDVRDTRSHQHNGSVKKPNTCQGARPPWYYLDRSGTVYRCGIQATTLHLQLHGFHMDISCRVSYGYIHIYIYIIVLYYIILYYFILFYIILYYIILYYVILKYIILHYIILYYFKLFYIILYCIILYYIFLYYIVLFFIILYYIVLYYTIFFILYIILYYILLYYIMLY